MVASPWSGAVVGSSWAFACPATIMATDATSATDAFRPVLVIARPSSYPEAGSAGENWHQGKSGVKCGHSGFTPRRDGAPLEVAGRGRDGARSARPDRPHQADPH